MKSRTHWIYTGVICVICVICVMDFCFSLAVSQLVKSDVPDSTFIFTLCTGNKDLKKKEGYSCTGEHDVTSLMTRLGI